MKVFAFVGPSGSGKSHRSTWVAKERQISFIIDDGLLIHGTRIVAGKSAKKEPNKIGSVKCALFHEDGHCYDVKSAIELYKPPSILILGTSDGMVENIAKRLGLPEISEIIYIHQVATAEEIEKARTIRKREGKHVIPVPTFELKKDFSGFFLDPLQIFRKKGQGHYQLIGEKSVVRPTFSYLGKYSISDYAIYQIVEYVALSKKGVHRIFRFRADKTAAGIYIDMDVILVYGFVIKPLLIEIQQEIQSEMERLTALNILALNITAKGLVLPHQEAHEAEPKGS